jgi:hypothetical protein
VGDPQAQAAVWAAHNPYDQAGRLRGIPIFLSAGNGQPGPFDPAGVAVDPLEQVLGLQAAEMADRLPRNGIRLTTHLYGPGTHSWPYWERELHRSFPLLMSSIGAHEPARYRLIGSIETRCRAVRQGTHERRDGGTDLPRRAPVHDVGGHQRNPETGHR